MGSALDRLREREQQRRAAAAPPGAATQKRRGIAAIAVAVLVFLAVKGKGVILVLATKAKLLLGAAKLGQLGTTAYTMVIAAWAYALYYGWSFAVGLVLLILVHELGHTAAAARVGLRVGAPMFIPFVGAFIALRDKPRSTVDESVVAAGGPLVGAIAAGATVAASYMAGGEPAGLLRVVGYYALVLNLFNLTPVWQLDGARMLAPVRARMMVGGGCVALAVLIGAAAATGRVDAIALIAIAVCLVRGGARLWRERRAAGGAAETTALGKLAQRRAAREAIPDDVAPGRRLGAAAVYFGALVGLTIAVHALHASLPPVR